MDDILKPLNVAKEFKTVPSDDEARAAVRTLLAFMGEQPDREGLVDTPMRVAKAYGELFSGYSQDPREELARTFEEVSGYDDIVLVRDISFFSHCEHHVVPFYGKAHIAYFPTNRVVGLSKLARVLEIYARRLQTQENLTSQVASVIEEVLQPRGVAVMVQAEHMCMTMRGVRKAGTSTITSRYIGCFRDDKDHQSQFLTMIRQK